MKNLQPKNLWVRFVQNGKKVSIAEYIRAKRYNICEPIDLSNMDALLEFQKQSKQFELSTSREIALTGESKAVNALIQALANLK